MNINAFYNGKFTSIEELKIPLDDRSIYFGDGIYDAFIGRGQQIYLKERHLLRFFSNAERMSLNHNLDAAALDSIFNTLIENFAGTDFFLYAQLSRRSKFRSHSYPDDADSNLLVTISPIQMRAHDTLLKVITYEDIRYELCNIKTLNLLPSVMASKEASRWGCDEAIFLRKGIVTECAHSNVFILKNDTLVTHPKDNHILPGITRQRLIELAKENSIKTVEARFALDDLLSADDIIITSTSKLAKRVIIKDYADSGKSANEATMTLCKAMQDDYLRSITSEKIY